MFQPPPDAVVPHLAASAANQQQKVEHHLPPSLPASRGEELSRSIGTALHGPTAGLAGDEGKPGCGESRRFGASARPTGWFDPPCCTHGARFILAGDARGGDPGPSPSANGECRLNIREERG